MLFCSLSLISQSHQLINLLLLLTTQHIDSGGGGGRGGGRETVKYNMQNDILTILYNLERGLGTRLEVNKAGMDWRHVKGAEG